MRSAEYKRSFYSRDRLSSWSPSLFTRSLLSSLSALSSVFAEGLDSFCAHRFTLVYSIVCLLISRSLNNNETLFRPLCLRYI